MRDAGFVVFVRFHTVFEERLAIIGRITMKGKKRIVVPDHVRAEISRHLEICFVCEKCSTPGIAVARIKKSRTVNRGWKYSPNYYNSEDAMRGQAKRQASKEIGEAKRHLASGIENAILHNIKIYDQEDENIHAQCINCGAAQLWAVIINRAILAKGLVGLWGVILAVVAFYIVPRFIFSIIETWSVLPKMLLWLVPPALFIASAIWIPRIVQDKSMALARNHLRKTAGSAILQVKGCITKSYKYESWDSD